MHYFSTRRLSPNVGFRDAVLNGQPPDKGLYFPSEIHQIEKGFLDSLLARKNEDIAFEVIRPFVAGDVSDEALFEICCETVDFDFPLVEITPRFYALELFHGPTLAFKDVGARFMSRCLGYFRKDNPRKTIVVVATSGDTGGAVAAGFHGVDGVEVVILFPKGKVSRIQELQLTTFGDNVITLEVRGDFDACQALAKAALADDDLSSNCDFTSANSINVARWLPQQFYYYFALKQWSGEPPVVSVPSGNFGNLAAGILAQRSGLPVKHFVAACNANDLIPRYLETGDLDVRPTIETLSNAMDVGDPSNFVRILEMLGKEPAGIRESITAISVSDDETRQTINKVFDEYGYILDPHGAVGFKALAYYLSDSRDRGVFLETAHPVKFDSVESILGRAIQKPDSVLQLESKTKVSAEIAADYGEFKDFLMTRI